MSLLFILLLVDPRFLARSVTSFVLVSPTSPNTNNLHRRRVVTFFLHVPSKRLPTAVTGRPSYWEAQWEDLLAQQRPALAGVGSCPTSGTRRNKTLRRPRLRLRLAVLRDTVLDDTCGTTLNGADGEVSSWSNMDSNLLNTTNENEPADPLVDAMTELKYSKQQRWAIVSELQRVGLWDAAAAASAPMVVAPGDTFRNNSSTSNSTSSSHHHPSQLLWTLMADWLDSSDAEQISSVLHRDFGLAVLHAHQVRAALQQMQKPKRHSNNFNNFNNTHDIHMEPKSLNQAERSVGTNQAVLVAVAEKQIIGNASSTTRGHYRELIVSPVARQRAAVTADSSSSSRPGERTSGSFTYGLTRRTLLDEFPLVNTELDAFFTFMTVPQAGAQVPLRPATAKVYRQHVLLFLGWYWNVHLPEMRDQVVDQQRLSIHQIFPNAKKESIQPVLLFLQWLRMTRHCSVSYEANLLRGLNKWLQFRFHNDDDNNNKNNNQDNELRRELRRWHCDANRRQAVAPRVADESRK